MIEPRFFILVAALLVANIVEAVTGFGGIIIAVTIAANFYPIPWLVTVLVPINIMISIYIVARHYRKTDVYELIGGFAKVVREKKLVPLSELMYGIMPFALVGMAVGIVVFNIAGNIWLKLAYGVFVLSFSAWELTRIMRTKEGAEQQPLSRLKSALWLMGGGFIQGVYASGGPMIVYYTSRKLKDKGVFRSTLSVLWLVLNGFVMTNHIVAGRHNAQTLAAIALLLPVLIVGVAIGEKLHGWIPERTFRIFVFAILLFAGAALIVSGAREAS